MGYRDREGGSKVAAAVRATAVLFPGSVARVFVACRACSEL